MVEFDRPELANSIAEVFHNGHRNFYENQRTIGEMRVTIEATEAALPMLEVLLHSNPLSFSIESNQQLGRLRGLTGNDDLQIGDSSPVGFSLKQTADRNGDSSRECRQFKNIGLQASVSVIPAKAGTWNPVAGKYAFAANGLWIPAFAGMTVNMTTLPRNDNTSE